MKNKLCSVVMAAGLVLAGSAIDGAACGLPGDSVALANLARQAVSEEAQTANAAIAALRARGAAGLLALVSANADSLSQYKKSGYPQDNPAWQRLQNALAKVSGQRDDQASGLYWYTDFGQAKAVAKACGKPILSLRLLGRLDEEFSCANSRFFRTTLYANAEVSKYLSGHFILHWQSVRPAPRITVDFGDGRKIERTITGNSIHYILDAEGRPIDALPGLYGAKAFLKGLADAGQAAAQAGQLTGAAREQFLAQYHRDRRDAILQDWNNDIAAGEKLLGAKQPPLAKTIETADDATWKALAVLHRDAAALDQASIALIKSKNPTAAQAMRAAYSKTVVESPLVTEIFNLQSDIAQDTVRNEYLFHSQIHQWLSGPAAFLGVDQLNERVYSQLFLTPSSDPWLGLAPANTFTGLNNEGLVAAPVTR